MAKKQSHSKTNNPTQDIKESLIKKIFSQADKILMVILTAGIVTCSALQVSSYKNIAQAENKAYLSIGDISTQDLLPNERVKTTIQVQNVGKTPAYKVNLRSAVRVGSSLAKSTLDTLRCLPTGDGYTIPPGGKIEFYIENFTLSEARISAILNDSLGLYLYGRFDYIDKFGDSDSITYAMIYVHNIKTRGFICAPFGN